MYRETGNEEATMIMTVDIGGTKTMWAFWEREGMERGEPLATDRRTTASIDDFVAFLKELTAGKDIKSLCFAMAGPVTDNKLELTNTGQVIDLVRIRESLPQIRHMGFLNDLEALGHSIGHLHGAQLKTFREGVAKEGAKAILSIGTGLGIAAVTREGIVLPSEGGHVDFAPRTLRQHEILQHLEAKYDGHVSYERLLSGHGLANIYSVISGGRDIDPAEISSRAAEREQEALETFDVFTEILGAACGNFALVYMASGGVYLGGGMMPKILSFLDRQIFERAFLDKGRFRPYLEKLPVFVIMDERAPSLGAAAFGAGAVGR